MVLAFGPYSFAGYGAWKGKRVSVGGMVNGTRPAPTLEDGLVRSAHWDARLPHCCMPLFHPDSRVVEWNSVDRLKNAFSILFGEERNLKRCFVTKGYLIVQKFKNKLIT